MFETDPTRRDLLRGGLALGAAAIAGGPVLARTLDSAATAAAAPRRCGKLSDIDHIVVLMQENRSFDQYFGTFPGVRGFDDRRNRQAFSQPGYTGKGSQKGHLLPFHFNGRRPVGQCVVDPTHDWAPQHRSFNHGRNNLFYRSHAPAEFDGPAAPGVMGYYRANDIPVHWRAGAGVHTLRRVLLLGAGADPAQPQLRGVGLARPGRPAGWTHARDELRRKRLRGRLHMADDARAALRARDHVEELHPGSAASSTTSSPASGTSRRTRR